MYQIRSVTRDAKAIGLGLPAVEAEISFWETNKKKVRSVKQRLEIIHCKKTFNREPNGI